MQDLTICFTKIEYSSEYHPECKCYYYNFKIISPESNKGNIGWIETHFETSKSYYQYDSFLPFDPVCDLLSRIPPKPYEKENLIPKSYVSCPDGWNGGHWAVFATYSFGDKSIKPGQIANFTITSKFPPGRIKLKLGPTDSFIEYNLVMENLGEEGWTVEDADPPYALGYFYSWELYAIGPVDPEELELFNG